MITSLAKRRTGWNYDRRYVGERHGGFEHSMELAGASGAHFHFWVPATATIEALRNAVSACRGQRDLVSWSWDYIPGQAPLTPSQQKAYVRSGGGVCPHCGSSEIESDRPDCDGAVGTANCKCLTCKAEWVDIWKLVGVESAEQTT